MADLLSSLPPLSSSDLEKALTDLKELSLVSEEAEQALKERKCETESSAELCPLGVAIQKRLETSLNKNDNSPKYTINQLSEKHFEIRTYTEVYDAANQRSGAWTVYWNMERVSETDANASGNIKFHGYSWEDGNYQIESSQEMETEVVSTVEEKVNSIVAKFEKQTMSYDEKLAKKIVEHLEKKESAFYKQIGELFTESTVEESFKRLRRILPVTKSRFKWDVAAQKQVSLLNARKSE